MFFSIVMPIYNGENYLRDCIDSYLAQTEKDYEIVLCDDCSTDNSLSICEEYSRLFPNQVRVLKNEKNKGVVLTKRLLFESALGEWIMCSDCDDKVETNTLKKIKAVIMQNKVDMVVFNAKCVHLDGHIEKYIPALTPNKLYTKDEKMEVYRAIYSNRYLNSLATKVFRRDILDRGADYQESKFLKSGEDIYQSYPLFDRANSIYYLSEALYIYIKREGSITGSFHKDFYLMRCVLWQRDDYYRNKWNLSDDISQLVNNNRLHEIINFLVGLIRHSTKIEWMRTVEEINSDGILKNAYNGCHVKGRYKKYCQLLIEKKYDILRIFLFVELIFINPFYNILEFIKRMIIDHFCISKT